MTRVAAFVLLVAVLLAGCRAHWRELPAPVSRAPVAPPEATLHAGIGRADITPPAGLGLAGYGPEGRRSRGYRQRLYARALVLQDRRGEKLALLVADLGFSSAMLHRLTAERVAERTGIGADRLIIAATHTHTGPSHYQDGELYNHLMSEVTHVDHRLVDLLVDRFTAAILHANGALAPARAAWGNVVLWGETRNRSLEAARRNPGGGERPDAPESLDPPYRAVDPTWTMLRVDIRDGDEGPYRPRAAFSLFGVHGTGNPSGEELYDSDLFGVFSRAVERAIDRTNGDPLFGVPRAVHLVAAGAAGDASPNWPPDSRCPPGRALLDHRRGPPEAIAWCLRSAREFVSSAGARIGRHALELFERLGGELRDDLLVSRAFRTVTAEELAAHGFCETPRAGVALLAGADDGRTRLYLNDVSPIGMVVEGAASSDPSRSCHAQKRVPLGWVQAPLVRRGGVPNVLQVGLFRVGGTVIAALPVEVTMHAAQRMEASVRQALEEAGQAPERVRVMTHANGYLSYVNTAEEYAAQTYEGGSNLYGPGSVEAYAWVLGELAARLAAAEEAPDHGVAPMRVNPGGRKSRLAPSDGGPAPEEVRRRASAWCLADTLVVEWIDVPPGRLLPLDAPLLVVERLEEGAAIPVVWDDDVWLEVRERGRAGREGFRWQARWAPAQWEQGAYRFRLPARPGLEEVVSDSVEACAPGSSPNAP